jgi:hypothetical protein
MLKAIAVLLALAAPLAAQAETLTAGQTKTTAFVDHSANIYYTVADELFEVVTTVAPGPDGVGRPMRFVSRLADGESQEISIGEVGEDTLLHVLTITRTDDRISYAVDARPVSWRRTMSASPAARLQ